MDFGHRHTGVGMEMLMDLSVYTLRSLQETAGLLTAMAMGGIDVERAMMVIAQEVAGRVDAIDHDTASQASRCPSCKKGSLRLCADASRLAGVVVLTCSDHCGYSLAGNQKWQQ